MKRLKIYICSHCDFECPVMNDFYTILDSRELDGDRTKEGLPGFYYSELNSYRYVAEHFDLPDYVGFCGYRKYFGFMGNTSEEELCSLVDKHVCICGELADFGNMTAKENYAFNHNKEDMELMEYVINDVSKDFLLPFTEFLYGKKMYTCNMFIMKREDFKEMIDYIFRILDEFTRRIGNDIIGHVEDAFKRGFLRLGGVRHQARIGGYIGERLVSAYIMWKFPDALSTGIKIVSERR